MNEGEGEWLGVRFRRGRRPGGPAALHRSAVFFSIPLEAVASRESLSDDLPSGTPDAFPVLPRHHCEPSQAPYDFGNFGSRSRPSAILDAVLQQKPFLLDFSNLVVR